MRKFLIVSLVLILGASFIFAGGSGETAAKEEAAVQTTVATTGPWKPVKPIKIIIPFNAGGSSDVACRILIEYLNKYSDVEFIVENVPGSGGQIGMERCATADPDGYTIVSIPTGWFMSYAIGNVKRTYSDYTPISTWADSFMALAVNSKSPYKTYDDFVRAAKNGNLLIGGVAGTLPTLAVFVTADKEGFTFRFTDVDEKAKQTELLSNRVDAYVDAYASVVRYVQSGDFRVLMLYTNAEVPNTEDIPKMNQLGYNMDPDFLAQRYSFWGPKNMNPEAVKYINNVIRQAAADPECQAALEKMFYGASWMSVSDYNAYCEKVQNDTAKKVNELF
ncbi:MAG: tripartite tricarboxylate transporter substrate binding protein [Spirochaetales bacterium]|nr:tripartite tricarboxylate transporter substrate binding protein [Spirochaetales bacterium]